MQIDVSLSGRRHRLRFFHDGDGRELFHADTINAFDDRQRQRLIKALVDNHGIDQEVAEEKMLAVMRGLVAQESRESEDPGDAASQRCPYRIQRDRFVHVESETVLSNFTAEIVEELSCDDGVESSRFFVIQGTLSDGAELPEIRVPAHKFESMDWVPEAWGSRAIIAAGRAARDHLRAAIQEFSGDVSQRTLYRHTGWLKVGDENVYLHAGGAIGVEGVAVGIDVDLPPALEQYELPVPPTGDALVESVQASLDFLDVGPDRVTVPLLAAAYRAVLGGTDFSLHVVGPSGAFKSTVVALAQQHFGSGLDATHLPGSWSSTSNSLEGIAFAAKDALLTIDDFAPVGNSNQIQSAHRDADRVIRAQGNKSGRQRMRADGTVRPTKPPRGLIVSTGEDVPRGHSIAARMLVLKLSPGEITGDRLTDRQRDALEGRYSASMAGFLKWVAPRHDEIQELLREEFSQFREAMQLEGLHARTPSIAAHLLAGIRCFLNFACDMECLTSSDTEAFVQRCRIALRDAISEQREEQATTAPEQQFLTLIASVLATGRAHLDPVENLRPDYLRHYGWHPSSTTHYSLVPRGEMIGYIQSDDVYLDPQAAFAAAQRLAREGGEAISIGLRTLVQRLYEAGMLIVEESQNTRLHRISVGGRRVRAIRLRPGALQNQEQAAVDSAGEGVSESTQASNPRLRGPRFPDRATSSA